MPDSRDDLRAQNVLFHLPAQPAHLIVDGSVQWTGDPAGAQFEQLVAANDRPWPLQEQGRKDAYVTLNAPKTGFDLLKEWNDD